MNPDTDAETPPTGSKEDGSPSALSSAQNRVIWTIWLTYGAFYFCRTNISAAVPGLKSPIAEGGQGLSGEEIGWILASLKIAYGLGQLVNGQFAERFSPRVLLAVGMFCSAGLNVLFGFSTGFYFLLFLWACNGYCQSLGWTPCVRVVGNWIPLLKRGKAIGIIGTGYQITLGLTYLVAGHAAEYLGWRGAMYVPAIILASAGVFMLLSLREKPADDAHASRDSSAGEMPHRGSFAENLFWTLFNPTLWLLGLSLGLLNACRYGFLDWGLTHLMEVQQTSVGRAGLKFFVIAIGAAAGSFIAGWATDRFFDGRRAPVTCVLLVLLGVLTLVYESAARTSAAGTVFLLVIIGFCIYGPQVLLVGTAPADLAHRRTSAAAAGFVNFMGYMGAATGDVVTGHVVDGAEGGWRIAIYLWASWALLAAFFSGLLWNATAKKVGLLPAALPKLVAVAAFATAGLILLLDDSAAHLRVALAGMRPAVIILSFLAAGLSCGSIVRRRIAMANPVLAALGLCFAFAAFVVLAPESNGPDSDVQVAWGQVTTIVAYGMALIASVMVLVERR